MLPFLNAKLIIGASIVLLVIGLLYGTYSKGYSDAETHYQALLTEFSQKAEKLRTFEDRITKEISVQYKDRVQTITEKEYVIVSSTDESLKGEALACNIGPNFIKLHNEAASK